jgi:peptide/nickel transport system permease protein
MGNDSTAISDIGESHSRISEWQRFRRVFLGRGVVVFGLVVIVIFIVVAIFAPLIAPYPPNKANLTNILAQPGQAHWLGTDQMGRDTLSRVIIGTRTSLMICLSVILISCAIGMALGVLAGYFGGWTYNIIMRLVDTFMSFPMILLALVIAALMGNGMRNVIIALSVAMVPVFARLMCGQVLSVKENDYVVAGYSIGARNMRIILHHIIPNCLSPLIVLTTMMMGSVILAEAGLSFLGVGINPPTAAWGSMVNDARIYILTNPVLAIAPGFVLMLVVFAFNMVGDGLRDALDPRLRGMF